MTYIYIYYIRHLKYEIPAIDYIIYDNFSQPFAFHITVLCSKIKRIQSYDCNFNATNQYMNDVKTMYKLSDEWTKILKSLKLTRYGV